MFLALLGVPAAAPPLCRAPPTWPAQFVIVQRKIPDDDSGNATTTTYYDWKRQANLIVITPDSNETDVLWDLELGSHHSFYFFSLAAVLQGDDISSWHAASRLARQCYVPRPEAVEWASNHCLDEGRFYNVLR